MKKLLLLILIGFFSISLSAQDEEPAAVPTDIEGCKDSPLFNRMPNTTIVECKNNYDLIEFPITNETTEAKEGTKTFIVYNYNTVGGGPSFFQIVKNHENAILKKGGKRIYYGNGLATLYFKNGNKDVWIRLEDGSGVNEGNYNITIIEVEPMKQEIVASEMLDALNNTGSVALYINFETGKAEIQPESQKIVDEIAVMLTLNPELKISIEGHTDNVGVAASNKTLSEKRAQAVMNALVAKGINKTRLTAKGWGQEKPVSDNTSEDGKAKNRRVEIVKI